MFKVRHRGNFKRTEAFLAKANKLKFISILNKYGKKGVAALAANTPRETGLTANSWDYEIVSEGTRTKLVFVNKNNQNGSNIAILLQYGHGTGTGGYVQGHDYINPAIQPLFDEMAADIWKEVTSI